LTSGWLKKLKKKNIIIIARSCFLQGLLLTNFTIKNFLKYKKLLNFWNYWCKKNRISKLKACLDYVRDGDTLVITKLDRLARSTLYLCQLAEILAKKEVSLQVLDQNIDTTNATSRIYGYPPVAFIDSSVTTIYLPSKPYTGQIITIRKTGTSTFSTVVRATNEHSFSGSITSTTTSGDFTMGTGIYAATFCIRSANGNVQSWYVLSTY
jgi:hypothetical protein